MEKINILDYRFDKYSNNGNDGIINFVLETMGKTGVGIFVEFGAWDGVKGSNCRLLYKKGWSGMFIESDKQKYRSLLDNYSNSDGIKCVHSKVAKDGKNSFDKLVSRKLGSVKIDFCSIDIDGLDVEIFETFKNHFPDFICIEGGQMLHPYHPRVPTSVAAKNIQQSLSVMNNVFTKKGYFLLGSYQDSFFIKSCFAHRFDVEKDIFVIYMNGLETIYRRIPFISKYTYNVGIKNPIIKYILKYSNYYKYGWSKRKKWAEKEKERALDAIKIIREKRMFE